jgi:dTDP-L-rhamnose 4-epimerase
MRIVITGGAGFIGSHLADRLVEEGHQVVAFDNLEPQVHPTKRRPSYLQPAVRLIEGDIRDRAAVIAAIDGAEAIFHMAAVVGVGQSQYEIARYTDVNVGGTAMLLDVLANTAHGVRKLIVASSMSIYGEGLYVDANGTPVSAGMRTAAQLEQKEFDFADPQTGTPLLARATPESKPADCQSIYALTKRDQEEYVLLFGRTYGLPVVAPRLFNTYGSRQSLKNPYTGAAAIFISRVQQGLPPLVYEDGAQKRDFVDVRDVARALSMLLQTDGADGRAINVASGACVSIAEVAARIGRMRSPAIPPEITLRARKGDIRHCFADISALRGLGFAPSIDLERGMRDLWDSSAAESDQPSGDVEGANDELLRRNLLV